MNLPEKLVDEIESHQIDEIRMTGEVDRSGRHRARNSAGKAVPFTLDWSIAWQVPGQPPTRIYSITLIQ
ncbi:MAG: hypothetical protein D3910_06965 [Candidatus Electrothrix sp. ATG2]|nr:hypothetical protein [Candidatus Electrothrix sp. ATG2]